MSTSMRAIVAHQSRLKACRICTEVVPPVVVGAAVRSPVLLIGQAPGEREGALNRPFAWTAGRTLFKWFAQIGMSEERFRARVYMSAVCRCFPGKRPGGGDRVPSRTEIANCRPWLEAELDLLQPELIIPVGRLAIAQFMTIDRLADVVGIAVRFSLKSRSSDVVGLPHPSGASTWYRTEPGRSQLAAALDLIAAHPAWQGIVHAP